jgi:acyl transferase domain-containing protein/acyl carrier protein
MSTVETQDSLESIAIIGMAGRFPGAGNVEQFWANLRAGVESISFFSDEELAAAGVEPALARDQSYVKAGAVLDDIECFDAAFFGLTPRVTAITDPQQRLLLECAWEALEHAGYDAERYQGAIGVFAGASFNTYLLTNYATNRTFMESIGMAQAAIANRTDHLATQICYKLNLTGPGVTVQTTCSTSLVAVHMACQSLLTYQCGMALAGGVTVRVPHRAGYLYEEGGIFSPDGHCRAFDAEAHGTVGGNGVGIVVLKRLADALAERDTIYAVIRGSAINNDGARKVGYTAPSVDGQARVIALAQALAGVEPATISYVEAHGTGTSLGDPIEIAALTKAFRASKQKHFCALGSVKTNVGHLDAAAGVTGLIKTTLALMHRQLPPSLHFTRPNPDIDFANSPFYVNTKLAEWPTGATPRRAGVSSFGIGGTNAHVVLEEAPQVAASGSSRPWQVLALSAKTQAVLETMTTNLLAYLRSRPELNFADVAYTYNLGRRAFDYRRAIVYRDRADAIAALETLNPKRVVSSAQEPASRPVAFLFPGQGAQHSGMAAELYQSEPVFRAQVDHCAELLKPHLGCDIREMLFDPSGRGSIYHAPTNDAPDSSFVLRPASAGNSALDQTQYAQPALFVIAYALAQLWMSWGIRPKALIGHSVGEYVAACLAGVLSLEDALTLVALRGRLMQRLPVGAMLVVALEEPAVRELLGERLSLAAVNRPGLCVVSGPTDAVATLERQLTARQIACRRLHTSHAFHSAMMDEILEPFAAYVRHIDLRPPQIPYISNVSGRWITAAEATDPGYWTRHLRQTVRFSEGLATLMQERERVLLEVGPGQTLATIARLHPARQAGQAVLASLPRADDQDSDLAAALIALGRLWLAGVPVNWAAFYAHEQRRRLPVPTYPFERQRYWIAPDQPTETGRARPTPPAGKRDMADWFYIPSWKRSMLPGSDIADRAIKEQPICWLVFLDACRIGAQIAGRLERMGHHVVSVMAGEEFYRVTDQLYTLNSGQPGHYHALLKDLQERGVLPQRVLHLWNVVPGGAQPLGDRMAQAQARGFYSLLYLAQALGSQQSTAAVRIDVIANNLHAVTGEEVICPEKATMLGPCRVIPQEYPHITCRNVDIVLPTLGGSQEAPLINRLVAEALAETADTVVAYRGSHRWVQIFESVRLAPVPTRPAALRERGVYLITGGLGGIGLTLADELARTVQARLVLTGRSNFPARDEWEHWLATHDTADAISGKIRSLRGLEERGAEVLVVGADVTDAAAMRAVAEQARQRFGAIQGIIHAAGVAGGGLIQLKTPDVAASVLAPKLDGTLTLAEVFKDTPLDFFVLCSSRISLLGGFGQVDYCAANAFLDAFAHAQAVGGGSWTVSINWCAWQDVGLLVNSAAQYATQAGIGAHAETAVAHPLFDTYRLETPEREVYTTRFSLGRHWVLSEHRIMGIPVIPGTTYLEMARAAFAKHADGNAIELRDVVFLMPASVRDGEQREMRLILEKTDDSYEFQFQSLPDGKSGESAPWQKHAIGKVRAIPILRKKHEIRAILERCQVKTVVFTDEDAKNEDHGPRWQNIRRIHFGDRELLTILELPAEFSGDLDLMGLHPALLDKTSGTTREFVTDEKPYMPFSYKRLRIYGSLPRRYYAYTTYKGDGLANGETQTADIVIMDEQGLEIAEVEAFSLKRVNDIATRFKTLAKNESQAERDRSQDASVSIGAQPQNRTESIYERILRGDGIYPNEGAEIFERILATPALSQIVVSVRDLQTVFDQMRDFTQTDLIDGMEAARPARAEHPRPEIKNPYVAPVDDLERDIAAIWQRVLGIEQIGLHDNFFELGGDSLIGIKIISELKQELQVDIPAVRLFEAPTVSSLAKYVRKEPEAQSSFQHNRARADKKREATERQRRLGQERKK